MTNIFEFMFKKSSKREERQKLIYEFYLDNRSEGKKYTIDHCRAANIIKRAESDSGHEIVSGSGRVAKTMTKTSIKRLKAMFEHRDGV